MFKIRLNNIEIECDTAENTLLMIRALQNDKAQPQPRYSARHGISGPKPKPYVEVLDEKSEIKVHLGRDMDEATYRDIILSIMRQHREPIRSGDIEDIVRERYPERTRSRNTIHSALAREAGRRDGMIERLEAGLYQLKK